jgi:hypothetical protein
MLGRITVRLLVLMCILSFASIAQGQDKLQNYLSDAASKVKATADASQKREILDKSFAKMSKALDIAQSSPLISKDDKAGISKFKAVLTEKQDELAGVNGYTAVPDAQLNIFADYAVQDMEQAQNISISLVAALLIVIIIILIA